MVPKLSAACAEPVDEVMALEIWNLQQCCGGASPKHMAVVLGTTPRNTEEDSAAGHSGYAQRPHNLALCALSSVCEQGAQGRGAGAGAANLGSFQCVAPAYLGSFQCAAPAPRWPSEGPPLGGIVAPASWAPPRRPAAFCPPVQAQAKARPWQLLHAGHDS